MTELIQQAIYKIDKEAEEINNAYITSKVVQRIIDTMIINDNNAQKILEKEKTLKGCIMSIYEHAKKNGNTQIQGAGSFVGGDDEDLWEWVCEYYGFEKLQSTATEKVNLFDVL